MVGWEDGRVLGVDERAVRREASRVARDVWEKVPERDWANRGIHEIGPLSFRPWDE